MAARVTWKEVLRHMDADALDVIGTSSMLPPKANMTIQVVAVDTKDSDDGNHGEVTIYYVRVP